jgi:hypothetical protein
VPPYFLQSNPKIESIATILEANSKNSFPGAINDTNCEETGGIDNLLNAEGTLFIPPKSVLGAHHNTTYWPSSQKKADTKKHGRSKTIHLVGTVREQIAGLGILQSDVSAHRFLIIVCHSGRLNDPYPRGKDASPFIVDIPLRGLVALVRGQWRDCVDVDLGSDEENALDFVGHGERMVG